MSAVKLMRVERNLKRNPATGRYHVFVNRGGVRRYGVTESLEAARALRDQFEATADKVEAQLKSYGGAWG